MDYLRKIQAAYQTRPVESIVKWPCCLWHDKSAGVSLFAGSAEDLYINFPHPQRECPRTLQTFVIQWAEGVHYQDWAKESLITW